jgi:nucleoside-diphosphate-sugar epimerase
METVGGWVEGKTILVTGGTGCVGSALLTRLSTLKPKRLVSVSRGITRGWPRAIGAEYIHADVRDQSTLTFIVADVRPDVIFHVAAQRDPGLAERTVHRTVTTNILGTNNVIAAAERTGVPRIVFASTGKTVTPYTPDVYASSKRIAEWLASNAAGRGDVLCTAARFTHLVDNSIVHQRILAGCENGLIRLHRARGAFYIQSALESAQLLICAGIENRAGSLGVHAISDLGWPIDLLSLALGALSRTGSSSAIYFSGHDPGYRSNEPFPGQYDSQSSWQFSPLINAFEASAARTADYGHVDIFPREPVADARLEANFVALRESCTEGENAEAILKELDTLSWSLFETTLDAIPAETLLQISNSGASRRSPEGIAHSRIMTVIENRAAMAYKHSIGYQKENGPVEP